MRIAQNERRLLCELARRLAEYAAAPRNAALVREWKRHNRLQQGKPMIVLMPEMTWTELIPEGRLQTMSPDARGLEMMLRKRIYHAEHFRDDTVIDNVIDVPVVCRHTGWGLAPRHRASSEQGGSWAFDPVLKDYGDLAKLHAPEPTVDRAATDGNVAEMQELFEGILAVRRAGLWPPVPALANFLTELRGLNQILMDVYENPKGIHAYMEFMVNAAGRLYDQVEAMGLVVMHNGNSILGTGGVALTDELPGPGYAGQARWRDCWATAECQEFEPMSPAMLDEFVLPYQARWLERFGLIGYGCCENLTRKFGVLKKRIPHLRRLSVAPWTDIRVAAEEIGNQYIYTRKPNPSLVAVTFDRESIRRELRETLDVTGGCIVEIVLKDIATVMGHPERLEFWVDAAQELAGSR